MKHVVTISARRLKRLESAEIVARSFRAFVGQRVCDQTVEQSGFLIDSLITYLKLAGTSGYSVPDGWPKNPTA